MEATGQRKRRPRRIPLDVRKNLVKLGYERWSSETTNSNLTDLLEIMARDMDKYKNEADYWQQQYNALVAAKKTQKKVPNDTQATNVIIPIKSESAAAGIDGNEFSWNSYPGLRASCNDSMSPDLDDLDGCTHEIDTTSFPASPLGHLIRHTAYTKIPDPVLSNFKIRTGGMPWINNAFEEVITSSSNFARMFGMYMNRSEGSNPLTRMKPNYDPNKARQAWNLITHEVSVPFSKINYFGSPPSRSSDPMDYDDEKDIFEHWISKASDFDVVDTMYYLAIFVNGTGCWHLGSPENAELFHHLGNIACRFIREAIFSRSLTDGKHLVVGIIHALVGLTRYFAFAKKFSAYETSLDIAWKIAAAHTDVVHPALRSLITFKSVFIEPSPPVQLWTRRAEELLEAADPSLKCFHFLAHIHATCCHGALVQRDSEKLMHHLTSFEEILAPDLTPPSNSEDSSDSTISPSPPSPAMPSSQILSQVTSHTFSSSLQQHVHNPYYCTGCLTQKQVLNFTQPTDSVPSFLHASSGSIQGLYSTPYSSSITQITTPTTDSKYLYSYTALQPSWVYDLSNSRCQSYECSSTPFQSNSWIKSSQDDLFYSPWFHYGETLESISEDSLVLLPCIPEEVHKSMNRATCCLVRAEYAALEGNLEASTAWIDAAERHIRYGKHESARVGANFIVAYMRTRFRYHPEGKAIVEEFKRRLPEYFSPQINSSPC